MNNLQNKSANFGKFPVAKLQPLLTPPVRPQAGPEHPIAAAPGGRFALIRFENIFSET